MRSSKLNINTISLLVCDFDGVLTDNRVLLTEHGSESVFVNRADGLAISKLNESYFPVVIISSEKNSVVKKRAEKLHIESFQGIDDKEKTLRNYCYNCGIGLENVIFIGNDINDLKVMKSVGWPICPSDGHDSVKSISRIILKTKGGEGVVRELLDRLIKE